MIPEHGGTEITEYRNIAVNLCAHGFSQFYTAAFHNYIDILARASEKTVTDITSDYKSPHAQFGSDIRNNRKNLMIKVTLSNCS